MVRKKKTVFFKVKICTCNHGKALHSGKCTIKGCGCTSFRFDREVVLSKEVFE